MHTWRSIGWNGATVIATVGCCFLQPGQGKYEVEVVLLKLKKLRKQLEKRAVARTAIGAVGFVISIIWI
jgi:hypothetical protein